MIGDDMMAILDAVEDPVLLLDAARRIVRTNQAARELLGQVLVGRPLVGVLRQPALINALESVAKGAVRAQATIRLSGGTDTSLRATVVPLRGQEASLALTLRDLSPLLSAARMRSDFVANVSHELRSPLTTLSGLIETLQGPARDDSAAQARFLDIMRREADRMDRLIHDLLSLSRVEENERVRPAEEVDLAALLDRTVKLAMRRPEAKGREVLWVPDAEGVTITGDEDQLQQVFANLLENALRYGSGTVRLSTLVLESAPRFVGPVLLVEVNDEGHGIAPEHLPRLTERFYRVDDGRSRAQGGTGLGLAICKHIVARHRGRMEISSALGQGTTVRVLLPASA